MGDTMATIRIECCDTELSAERRRGALERLGFGVEIFRDATVVKSDCGKKNEQVIFRDCKFLVRAEKP